MASQNFLSNIQYLLYFQYFHGITPFLYYNNKFITKWFLQFYIYLTLFSIVVASIISFKSFYDKQIIEKLFSYGYLWGFLGTFEITLTFVIYAVMIIVCSLTKNSQMKILQKLHDIDELVYKRFHIRPNYNRERWIIFSGILVIWVYYQTISLFVMVGYSNFSLTDFDGYLFSLCYFYEQVSAAVEAHTYNNYVWSICRRFNIIRTIQNKLNSELGNSQKNSNDYVEKVAILFEVYKDLVDIIDIMNSTCGQLLILRFAHGFTLTTSQFYLIFTFTFNRYAKNKFVIIVHIFAWMIQNGMKMILTCFCTDQTITKVYNFILEKTMEKLEKVYF